MITSILAAGAASLLAPAVSAALPSGFFGTTAVQPTAADFHRMGDRGIEAFRFGINWRGVQPVADGEYRWGGPDRTFRQASIHGLEPVPLLIGSPQYVSADPAQLWPPLDSDANRERWRRFVAAAVERYRPGGEFWTRSPNLRPRPARTWLVWNEQNAHAFWRPRAQPHRYAQLVRMTARAIRSVDPGARVVVGGMYGYPGHPRSMRMRPFLRRLYRQRGISRMINGVAVHPYGPTMSVMRRQVREARRVMNRNGHRRGGIWIGEIGWASAGDRGNPMVTTRKGQARKLRQAVRILVRNRERWRLRGIFTYVWRDHRGDDICNWCRKAGLLTRRGKAKPALRAYRRAITSHRG